jgi:hypothetical protein
MAHEKIFGCIRHDKAFRNREPESRFDLSQVSHFASDLIDHVLVHGFQGQNEFPLGEAGWFLQDAVDGIADILENVVEFFISMRRNSIYVLNHLIYIVGNGPTAGSNESHAKTIASMDGMFHVGHDLQNRAVGIQNRLEILIPRPKKSPQFLVRHFPLRIRPSKKIFEEFDDL